MIKHTIAAAVLAGLALTVLGGTANAAPSPAMPLTAAAPASPSVRGGEDDQGGRDDDRRKAGKRQQHDDRANTARRYERDND
ncbi:hypothetical protein GCM10018785_14330 [Streptomyces longispororuber]|uniref:Secreted protein n=1 Tax=Streptomyces longispororuber TaxID=68230 RepID=A0A918ZDL0_9ACTN|nr:hypothetical protein [Streptomyces longispororuber]GHE45798.1 hypothetical protein GCM10018785_14330 [Streptomyces longispororuber]